MIEQETEQLLRKAIAEAHQLRYKFVTVEHFLKVLLDELSVHQLLTTCQANIEELRADLSTHIKENATVEDRDGAVDVQLSEDLIQVIKQAFNQSEGQEATGIRLLVAIFSQKASLAVFYLHKQDVTRHKILWINKNLHQDKPPESYLDCKRPSLPEAAKLEGGTVEEALASLKRKGYFTPPPRPWTLGFSDRGMGRGDYAILDKFGDLVAQIPDRETAEFIIAAVNNFKE